MVDKSLPSAAAKALAGVSLCFLPLCPKTDMAMGVCQAGIWLKKKIS